MRVERSVVCKLSRWTRSRWPQTHPGKACTQSITMADFGGECCLGGTGGKSGGQIDFKKTPIRGLSVEKNATTGTASLENQEAGGKGTGGWW